MLFRSLTEDYETVQIRIAFNPQDEKFEVANPAIRKNPAWLPDVAAVFDTKASMFQLVSAYCEANPGSSQDAVFKVIERLHQRYNTLRVARERAELLALATKS